MMSALGEEGLLGMTAIGNSHDEADAFYARTVEALTAAARMIRSRTGGLK
jgi:hypothetical protein